MNSMNENSFICERYNPDNIFKRFKVVEFPISLVGLSTTDELDLEMSLTHSVYLKTMHEGGLVKFEEARKTSASHRSFIVTPINDHTIRITFKPLSECISKHKHHLKYFGNRFVFDLRLIKVDGSRCCNRETHAEVGRFYVCGEYEYCNISHSPKTINFGDVEISTRKSKYVRIRNESKLIAAKMNYVKVTGFEVTPSKFTILPNSSKRIMVSIKPTSLKMGNTLMFKIRNPHDDTDEKIGTKEECDDNYISYTIGAELNVIYNKKPREVIVESLHKLDEQNPRYTYLNKELTAHQNRKAIGYKFLEDSKSAHIIKSKLPIITGKEKCHSDSSSLKQKKYGGDFCKIYREYAKSYDLFNILLFPFSIDFGEIAINTYGEFDLIVKNNSRYQVTIKLLNDACILYTHEKLKHLIIKLKPLTETTVTILCNGFITGNFHGTFKYVIDGKYHLKHPYTLLVSNAKLMIQEQSLKFGMVTSESFVTSVPVRICNSFNIPVDFEWTELHPDIPFEIIPTSGSVPKHGCKICDILYVSKPTKTKTHEVELISKGTVLKVIPIELNVITRKLSIKFLQQVVLFKDIALNLETIERVKLENSSREIALFFVVEPLLPGVTVQPMSGILRPKMILTFNIKIKISCVMEFSFDLYIKINNKETLFLPISGNVIEPKLTIQPKNIYMSRVPCGMITYVPITLQNLSALKAVIEVLDTGDENMFHVYIAHGNDKQRVLEFIIEGGQSKIVYIKVSDVFRREYDMYIPFKINGLLGPPNLQNPLSTELHYYIGPYEEYYENNLRVKVKSVNKDISYCRIGGVITVSWIEFSVERFEIEYVPGGNNSIDFTMTNVSKYYLFITINTTKISPYFTLNVETENNQSIINETNIKFELDRGAQVQLTIKFHPKGHGRFIAVAPLYLDKNLTIPYYNLTFYGKRQTPLMMPSIHRIIFPPCYVGVEMNREITLKMEGNVSDLEPFTCSSKEEPNLVVKFTKCEVIKEEEMFYTIVSVTIKICCQSTYARTLTLIFHHECGSSCDVEVNFCFTYCPLTLHTHCMVKPEEDPYPYFPLLTQTDLYEYLEKCSNFLEKWMFQQGFRRDLYPVIPDTFHAISSAISSPVAMKQTKGITVSYLNFIRRIAGPLMKHVKKISAHGVDESFKYIKEIHDTYREIIMLLKSRGADLFTLRAKFLLSYDQFVIYTEKVTSNCNADIILIRELLADVHLYNRLNKQSWIDFILQSYKVFVMDSCFFDCVCVSSQPRDIIKVLVNWYNEQILTQHHTFREKTKALKVIANLTTDMSDGIAIVAAFIHYCPFLKEHFSIFSEVDDTDREGSIINNACLIIEAMNLLKMFFPLGSKDFLQPNFLQMLFLSIHLYVILPTFNPKDVIKFNPPLLRTGARQLSIFPTSQESLSFTFTLLNNNKNNFTVEKAPAGENGKKMLLMVKYIANFIKKSESILLLHGYNKTRVFDTYIIFILSGKIGGFYPARKCKVTGPLYRPVKVDVAVNSPFHTAATYRLYQTDIEPTLPVHIEDITSHRFHLRRLNLIDREITLPGTPKEGSELAEHKLYFQMICLSTQLGCTWVWFRSEAGDFYIKIATQPRWDLALDTLQVGVKTWPMDPCSCGEACECYRSTVLLIPHRNELMVKSMRYALLENASDTMMKIFDELIETATGKIILRMLLTESGVNISDVAHILREQNTFRVTSRTLLPRLDRVTLYQHTDAVLVLPVTIPPHDKSEKYAVTFTSDCGMDIRTYKILFIPDSGSNGYNSP